MTREKYKGLLEIAKEQVKFGIYAIEKQDYAELRADKCKSITKLNKSIGILKKQGFKVYSVRG